MAFSTHHLYRAVFKMHKEHVICDAKREISSNKDVCREWP